MFCLLYHIEEELYVDAGGAWCSPINNRFPAEYMVKGAPDPLIFFFNVNCDPVGAMESATGEIFHFVFDKFILVEITKEGKPLHEDPLWLGDEYNDYRKALLDLRIAIENTLLICSASNSGTSFLYIGNTTSSSS